MHSMLVKERNQDGIKERREGRREGELEILPCVMHRRTRGG